MTGPQHFREIEPSRKHRSRGQIDHGHLSKRKRAVPPGSTFNILWSGLIWQVAMAANEEPTDRLEPSPAQILYQGKRKLMLLASKPRPELTPSNRHLVPHSHALLSSMRNENIPLKSQCGPGTFSSHLYT